MLLTSNWCLYWELLIVVDYPSFFFFGGSWWFTFFEKSPGRIGQIFFFNRWMWNIIIFEKRWHGLKWWEKVFGSLGKSIESISGCFRWKATWYQQKTWVYCWIPDVFWICEMHAYCYWNAPQTSTFSGSKHLLRTRVHPHTHPKYTLHSQFWSTWITTKGYLQIGSEINWQTTRPIHTPQKFLYIDTKKRVILKRRHLFQSICFGGYTPVN